MPKSPFAKILSQPLRIRRKFRKLFPSRTLSLFRGLVGKTPRVRQPWTVKDFSNADFQRIDPGELIEEENLPGYAADRYYPVRIGEVFTSRYQVVGKLGFGMTSTVWLARDLKECRYVSLKIYIRPSVSALYEPPELAAYECLERGPESHPGRGAIRSLLDWFTITGPDGEYYCLVHPPLWGSLYDWLKIHPTESTRLFPPLLAVVLRQLFLALDYAKECQIIHTDISPSNIMFEIEDTTVFEQFEQAELEHPTPRKEINGRFIYQSRSIQLPGPPGSSDGLGLPILCDFGAAIWAEEKCDEEVQPDIYRSPEVILGMPWSHEIDIWNVGCLVWTLFEGIHLFHGFDEHNDEHEYSTYTHLSEMISFLGLPPSEFLARGSLSTFKFFCPDGNGKFIAGSDVPLAEPIPLADLETTLEAWEGKGEDRNMFLRFMSKMMQWNPQDRQTAKQLLEDEWLTARLKNPMGLTARGVDEEPK